MNLPAMAAYYVEYASGYCTIVNASEAKRAETAAGKSRVPGDRIAKVRPATKADTEWFGRMGGVTR
jgi:hypothetical protein